MRVVSGISKGIPLDAPKGLSTRPTTDKVKEAVYSSIQGRIDKASVLDLFAGSGGMGIEALSRGAAECVFVDADKSAIHCIKNNLTKAHLEGIVIEKEALRFLRGCDKKFDIIFSDPPYNKGLTQRLIPLASNLLNDNGVLLCETDDAEPRPEPTDGLVVHKVYKYGRVIITAFVKMISGGDE